MQEEIFDMIDREADGSDSLEVGSLYFHDSNIGSLAVGIYVPAFNCWRHGFGIGQFYPGTDE